MMKFYYTVLVLFFSVLIISTIYILYYNEDLFKTKYIAPRKNVCPYNWNYVDDHSGKYCETNDSVNNGSLYDTYSNIFEESEEYNMIKKNKKHLTKIYDLLGNKIEFDEYDDVMNEISTNTNTFNYRYYLDNSDCTKYKWAKEHDVKWSGYSNLNEKHFCADYNERYGKYKTTLLRLFENKNSTELYNEKLTHYASRQKNDHYFIYGLLLNICVALYVLLTIKLHKNYLYTNFSKIISAIKLYTNNSNNMTEINFYTKYPKFTRNIPNLLL